MKKLLSVLMMLAIVFTLASCSEIQNAISGLFGPNEEPHEHSYTVKCTAKCEKDGENVYTCECGDTYSEPVAAFGHDFQKTGSIETTCVNDGIDYISCTKCGESNNVVTKAYGHVYGTPENPSDLVLCQRNGCKSVTVIFPEDGKYVETLTFNFTDEHKAELASMLEQILGLLESAERYDATLHGYAEEGELAEAFAAIDALHTEYYELVLYAVAQRQIAEIDYYCDMKNKDLEARYSDMLAYYTDLIADFYSVSRPYYDSCYREFYYYGLSEEEINAFLFDSDTLSNPEYTALKNRNDEIEVEFVALASPNTDPKVLALYSEFVANNNKMAELMGYENYLEYAYENVYSRDYSYKEVDAIREYVKKYLVPIYLTISAGDYTSAESTEYGEVANKSFFSNQKVNSLVNSYFKFMSIGSGEDEISFYDVFNDLCADGNMYRGNYAGAFVTYLSAFDLPIAYFGGSSYSTGFTITHEFGHYMNEIYNKSEYDQSYDLLEMHSQGDELIFLNFIKSEMSEGAYRILETSTIKDMLQTIIIALCVDAFEQAVYLDNYTGYGCENIMADGTITADEYDSLFYLVLSDMGVGGLMNSAYWRYVTIKAPCYYVSYSISAISVIQLHDIANTQSLEAAKDAYLKLLTYTDVNPDMTTEEVLLYAGMRSYNDEELYSSLAAYFAQ